MEKVLLSFDDVRDMTLELNNSVTKKEFNSTFVRLTIISFISYLATLSLIICYLTGSLRTLLGLFVTLAVLVLYNYVCKLCATEEDFYFKVKNIICGKFKLFIVLDTVLVLFSVVGYKFL